MPPSRWREIRALSSIKGTSSIALSPSTEASLTGLRCYVQRSRAPARPLPAAQHCDESSHDLKDPWMA